MDRGYNDYSLKRIHAAKSFWTAVKININNIPKIKMDQAALAYQIFFGYSENAVKTQIWIAISIYVLVAIMKKCLGLDQSLYTILQVISIALFEKIPIYQLVNESHYRSKFTSGHIQLNLFES